MSVSFRLLEGVWYGHPTHSIFASLLGRPLRVRRLLIVNLGMPGVYLLAEEELCGE